MKYRSIGAACLAVALAAASPALARGGGGHGVEAVAMEEAASVAEVSTEVAWAAEVSMAASPVVAFAEPVRI